LNYTIPVLQSRERYKITLLFDEPMFSTPNSRLFDVYVEGLLMRSKVDPLLLGGGKNKMASVSIALNERIKDGNLNILVKAVPTPKNGIQRALLNGIMIEISPYRQLVDFPLRINSGSSVSWIDPVTKLEWVSDTDYDKPTIAVNDCQTSSKDQLYCNYRMGLIINYAVRVLDFAARYKVTFFMQEPSFMGPGQRMMDIFIEDKLVSGGFDIVKFVGARHKPAFFAITTDKIVDGVINIKLKSTSGKSSTGQRVLIGTFPKLPT
jgi:Malectin domain